MSSASEATTGRAISAMKRGRPPRSFGVSLMATAPDRVDWPGAEG